MARLTLAWRPGQCPTWRTSRKSSTPVHWWKRLNAEVHEEIIRWALSSSKTYMHSNETGNLSLFHLLSLCTKPLCDQSMQFNLKVIWSTLPLHIFVTVSNVLLCKLKLFRSNAPTPGGGGVLPYKGLMETCGQPGYVFRDFCLKQGIEFIIFCLNQGIDSSIFVLNRISFLGR